ncbi:uncharacterized protein LOC143302303 [Babylonia areolata]|uniref:uncharacterized protein LOC143302303 n=1 Tax=Babylonia areolata TaxID=304850 RepID=UPI003FD5DDB9
MELFPFHWILFTLLMGLPVACTFTTGSQSAEEELPWDDGSGSASDDQDFFNPFSDVMSPASDAISPVRCYKCLGVRGEFGCNVTSLRQSPETYLTGCSGHCLNMTTEYGTIFDCVEKVAVTAARCVKGGDSVMCVCGTDICNGPPGDKDSDVVELPPSRQGIRLRSEHEVDIVLPRHLRQHLQDTRPDNRRNSGSHCVMLCNGLFFLVKLWCCYTMWKGYRL